VTAPTVGRTRPSTTPELAPWWLAAIVLVTLLGFQRTIAKGPTALDLAHAVHGSTALGWSLLLVAQAWLAEQQRRDWHRQLAIAGVMCAVALVATSLPMMAALASGAAANAQFRPIGTRLFIMDALLLALFVLLFAVAMAHVRRPAIHARALAATGLLALPAGLGRAYMCLLSTDPMTGSYLALGTGAVVLVALIVVERRAGARDRVFPAVLVGFALVGAMTELTASSAWVSALVRAFARA
jgi:hypothetical protein